MESAPAPGCYRHPNVPTRIVCQRCTRPICPQCMIPGSVGFQCPECVAQGMRQTRQLQLPYGGTRSKDPRITTFVLLGINVLVWLAITVTGGRFSSLIDFFSIRALGACPTEGGDRVWLTDQAGCLSQGLTWLDGVGTGAWWQIITNAFTHVDLIHIAANMFALYVIGPQLEGIFGRARFLAIYFASALMASAFVMWFTAPWMATVGASGAIFGMFGAVLLVVWKHKGNLRNILMLLGLNVAITVFGSSFISWQGHLGGFVGGVLATAALMFLPKERRKPWQWVLVVAVAVLAVALCVVRAVQFASGWTYSSR